MQFVPSIHTRNIETLKGNRVSQIIYNIYLLLDLQYSRNLFGLNCTVLGLHVLPVFTQVLRFPPTTQRYASVVRFIGSNSKLEKMDGWIMLKLSQMKVNSSLSWCRHVYCLSSGV